MTPEDAREYSESLGQIGGGWFRQVALGVKMGVPRALGLTREEWCSSFKVALRSSERLEAVQELHDEGFSNRQIADVLGVAPATVDRDLAASNEAPEEHAPEAEEKATASNEAPNGEAFPPEKVEEINHWAGARNMVDAVDILCIPFDRAHELAEYVHSHLEAKYRKKMTASRAMHAAEFLSKFALSLGVLERIKK